MWHKFDAESYRPLLRKTVNGLLNLHYLGDKKQR